MNLKSKCMTKRVISGYLLMLWIVSACTINQSIKKDLGSGSYLRGNGMSCDDVRMLINGNSVFRSTFTQGEEVVFLFNNITGLEEHKGKVYPGLSLIIVKNGKDTVLSNRDLLADLKNGTNLKPLQLTARFRSMLPPDKGDTYKVCVNIWDKKGKGTIYYELPFTMKENKVLKVNTQNLEYTNAYLWDDTQKIVVVDKKIKSSNTYVLILEGLDGLKVMNERVHPAFSIAINDRAGNVILSESNVLEEHTSAGIAYEDFILSQFPVTINFTPGKINNPCTLNAVFSDLHSANKLSIEAQLIVEE